MANIPIPRPQAGVMGLEEPPQLHHIPNFPLVGEGWDMKKPNGCQNCITHINKGFEDFCTYLRGESFEFRRAKGFLDKEIEWNYLLHHFGRIYTFYDTLNQILSGNRCDVLKHVLEVHRFHLNFRQCLAEHASDVGNPFMGWAMTARLDPGRYDKEISETLGYLLKATSERQAYPNDSRTGFSDPQRQAALQQGIKFSLVRNTMEIHKGKESNGGANMKLHEEKESSDKPPALHVETPLRWAMTTESLPETATVLVEHGASLNETVTDTTEHGRKLTLRHHLFIPTPGHGMAVVREPQYMRLLERCWDADTGGNAGAVERTAMLWAETFNKAIRICHERMSSNGKPTYWDKSLKSPQEFEPHRLVMAANFILGKAGTTVAHILDLKYLPKASVTSTPAQRAGPTPSLRGSSIGVPVGTSYPQPSQTQQPMTLQQQGRGIKQEEDSQRGLSVSGSHRQTAGQYLPAPSSVSPQRSRTHRYRPPRSGPYETPDRQGRNRRDNQNQSSRTGSSRD